MNDIKLIVTDMDGTFLNSDHQVSPQFPALYQELEHRNVLFVPASGRQMAGITHYFETIKNKIAFIAENGAYVIYKGEEVFADKMKEEDIRAIIDEVRRIPGAKAVVSAKKTAYYETYDQEFIDFFSFYYTENSFIDDLQKVVSLDDVFKIAVYHPQGSEENIYPSLKHFETKNLEVVVSGAFWLDVMNKNINKGKAVQKLQHILNITPQQTMAFGDYMNDLEMLKNAHYSYAMENAHTNVKKTAAFQALSNNEFGVVEVIKDFLSHP